MPVKFAVNDVPLCQSCQMLMMLMMSNLSCISFGVLLLWVHFIHIIVFIGLFYNLVARKVFLAKFSILSFLFSFECCSVAVIFS